MDLPACCIVCGSGDVVCLSFPLVGAGHRLTVIWVVVVVFVVAGWLHLFVGLSFVGLSFVGLWLLFAGHCPLCMHLSSCWVVGIVCGGVGGVTWHAGNMEGTPCVVDAGDVVWLSGLLVSWLSCSVGGVGC